MPDDTLSPKDSMDHAWRYFALHASQRMTMFNYFVVVFGIVSAGLAGCLRSGGGFLLVGATLGLVLFTVTFTFWKLDQRSAFLVKHAETALCELERLHIVVAGRLFYAETDHTRDAQVFGKLWTYGKSFRVVFSVAAGVGVMATVLCIVLYAMGGAHAPASPR